LKVDLKKEFNKEMHIRHKKRTFKSKIVSHKPGLRLMLPERQFFIQLIKFAPGKGPKDYFDFYIKLDKKLQQMYGGNRCDGMDIHEIVSFVTWGNYDMVVLWDAPDMRTANKFLAAWVDPDGWNSNTLPVAVIPMHPPW
jgi:hypothetical protein